MVKLRCAITSSVILISSESKVELIDANDVELVCIFDDVLLVLIVELVCIFNDVLLVLIVELVCIFNVVLIGRL